LEPKLVLLPVSPTTIWEKTTWLATETLNNSDLCKLDLFVTKSFVLETHPCRSQRMGRRQAVSRSTLTVQPALPGAMLRWARPGPFCGRSTSASMQTLMSTVNGSMI
jgi:hypothetical protein